MKSSSYGVISGFFHSLFFPFRERTLTAQTIISLEVPQVPAVEGETRSLSVRSSSHNSHSCQSDTNYVWWGKKSRSVSASRPAQEHVDKWLVFSARAWKELKGVSLGLQCQSVRRRFRPGCAATRGHQRVYALLSFWPFCLVSTLPDSQWSCSVTSSRKLRFQKKAAVLLSCWSRDLNHKDFRSEPNFSDLWATNSPAPFGIENGIKNDWDGGHSFTYCLVNVVSVCS